MFTFPSHPTRPPRPERRPERSLEDEAGFTLVELLVVLAIIVLVAGIVAPQVLRYLGSARSDAALAQLDNIGSALELFYIDNLRYPTEQEGLAVLSEPTPELSQRWNGPYLRNADTLRDPWGNSYIYRSDGRAYEILSLGRDGLPDGAGEDRDLSSR